MRASRAHFEAGDDWSGEAEEAELRQQPRTWQSAMSELRRKYRADY